MTISICRIQMKRGRLMSLPPAHLASRTKKMLTLTAKQSQRDAATYFKRGSNWAAWALGESSKLTGQLIPKEPHQRLRNLLTPERHEQWTGFRVPFWLITLITRSIRQPAERISGRTWRRYSADLCRSACRLRPSPAAWSCSAAACSPPLVPFTVESGIQLKP